jgi:hypothetical protein
MSATGIRKSWTLACRGVPVEVIAKIVDEAILVQYAAIPIPMRTLFSEVGEQLDSDYSDGRRHPFFFF